MDKVAVEQSSLQNRAKKVNAMLAQQYAGRALEDEIQPTGATWLQRLRRSLSFSAFLAKLREDDGYVDKYEEMMDDNDPNVSYLLKEWP